MAPLITIRPLRRGDGRAARALIEQELGGTPYLETPLWALAESLGDGSGEARGLAAERAGELVGVALYGEFAGATGAGRAHLVVVSASARLQQIGIRLLEAVHEDLARHGARFVLAEAPEDAISRPARELLEKGGYIEEGRIEDFYREGVALLLLRKPLHRESRNDIASC